MTEYEDFDNQLRRWLAEDELWAREASRNDGEPVPEGGVHWQWVSDDDEVIELDTATMAWVDEEGSGISLRSREEWPSDYGPLPQFAISSVDEVHIAVGGHIIRHDPARVLADIAGKVALLDHVAAWEHTVVDGDGYYSCGLAVDPEMPFPEPGTGCWDQQLAGIRCTCGLDGRRIAVLKCIAAGYAERPGFKPEWRLA